MTCVRTLIQQSSPKRLPVQAGNPLPVHESIFMLLPGSDLNRPAGFRSAHG